MLLLSLDANSSFNVKKVIFDMILSSHPSMVNRLNLDVSINIFISTVYHIIYSGSGRCSKRCGNLSE